MQTSKHVMPCAAIGQRVQLIRIWQWLEWIDGQGISEEWDCSRERTCASMGATGCEVRRRNGAPS